jgi:hypothetical protein
MSRRSPRLPHGGDVVSGGGFYPGPDDWASVEDALGAPLSDAERSTLRDRGDWYQFYCKSEWSAPPAALAIARAKDIRAQAKALAELLNPRAETLGWRVCNALDQALQDTSGEQNLRLHQELERARRLLSRIASAANSACQQFEAEATTQKPSDAWNWLISDLAVFFKERGHRVSARRDMGGGSNLDHRPSNFVAFIGAFLELMPREYRRGTYSPLALSKEVSVALRHRKSVPKGGAERHE